MWLDLLLSRDPPTRVRLLRQLMGLGSYLMFLAPLLLAIDSGWTQFGYRWLLGFTMVALAVNAAFFIAIRSGCTRRFADPSLLVWQILVALALALVMIHYTGEARSILLMLFVAMFFFGLFSLTTREFLGLAVAAIGGYAALMLFEFRGRELTGDRFRMELLRLVALGMITVWLSFIGGYFASLRRTLAERKDALAQALAQVRELSERDELTGAHNRRHLLRTLDRESARAERFNAPFSVAIIDLDHFKRFNDQHGHQVGDEILRGFSDLVRGTARELDVLARQDVDDTFGRYGGEEFLLVMPHTAGAGATLCLDRIRAAVETHAFATHAGPLQATFSAGVAEYRPGEPAADLLARADAALYGAKTAGRNRVMLADDTRLPGAG